MTDDPAPPSAATQEPRPLEERLAAALAASAARDRLLEERTRRLLALEDVSDHLAAARARVGELSAELAALRLARRAELAERDARITRLQGALAAVPAPAEGAAPDDLKRIRGVGPAIEALLHGIGITRFWQIAELSADDRRRVGSLLGLFASRIERDEWVAQARALAGEARPPRSH